MARAVRVDPRECTGCEYCVDSLPGVFRMNTGGVSEVHNPSGSAEERIRDVADNCPAECIHLE